jgi:hypothetical protein
MKYSLQSHDEPGADRHLPKMSSSRPDASLPPASRAVLIRPVVER